MQKGTKKELPFSKVAGKVTPGPESSEVPSIKAIKEKILIRINNLVNESTDAARLAQAYKILSEYEATDDKKGRKSVVESVMDNIKPLGTGEDEVRPVSLLDVIQSDGKAPINTKRKPGRPPRVKSGNSPIVKPLAEK